MTTVDERRSGRLNINQVVGGTFAAVSRNLANYLILAFALVGAPQVVLGWLRREILRATPTLAGGGSDGANVHVALLALATIALALASIFFWALLEAAVMYGVIEDRSGRKRALSELASFGLGAAPALVAISLMFGVVFGVGLLLLVVPGLIILTRWMVAAPARIAEGAGISRAFSRSAALTHGNRGAVLAIVVLFSLPIWLITSVLLGSAVALSPATFDPVAASLSIPYILTSALLNVVVGVIGSAGVASVYCELRRLKGEDPRLAAVFE